MKDSFLKGIVIIVVIVILYISSYFVFRFTHVITHYQGVEGSWFEPEGGFIFFLGGFIILFIVLRKETPTVNSYSNIILNAAHVLCISAVLLDYNFLWAIAFICVCFSYCINYKSSAGLFKIICPILIVALSFPAASYIINIIVSEFIVNSTQIVILAKFLISLFLVNILMLIKKEKSDEVSKAGILKSPVFTLLFILLWPFLSSFGVHENTEHKMPGFLLEHWIGEKLPLDRNIENFFTKDQVI